MDMLHLLVKYLMMLEIKWAQPCSSATKHLEHLTAKPGNNQI